MPCSPFFATDPTLRRPGRAVELPHAVSGRRCAGRTREHCGDAPHHVRVDGIDDVLARLHDRHGAELIGEVAQYQDSYRLCYVRGPDGAIVALAEQIS